MGCTPSAPGRQAERAPAASFHVATNGNDAWSGTLADPNGSKTNGPFATLARARDAVRELKARGRHAGPIVVVVRGGTYHLDEPLRLGPEDSGAAEQPIIYCAYPGEEVTLSGGKPITGWRKGDGELWVADVPEAKKSWNFRQLFFGGERQIRARTPNFDPKNPTTGGWAFVQKAKDGQVGKVKPPAAKDRFHFREGDIGHWPRSPEPEIHIFPAWGWVNAILSVDKVDHENRVVHVKNRNCSQELRPGNRYFVENVFEALDTPGEWFLDRAEGKLYYWPKEPDVAKKGVVAPALDRLIEIAGVEPPHELEKVEKEGKVRIEAGRPAPPEFAEHIVIRGFTFRHTEYSLEVGSVYAPDDAAIWLRRARHCVVEGCKFLGIGGYAVRLSDNASHNAILGCEVADAGQGGVLMTGNTATQPTDNLVAGNHIHHCGTIWKHVAGVYVTTGSSNRIAHNTITDVPRYGISLKTYDASAVSHRNVVEFNKLLRTNLETNDTGAIETLGRDQADTGNVIRGNLILDVVGLGTTETGEMLTPYYTWGIYLDDFSSGTTITGNIVARTVRGGVHVHLGRNNTIENNILVDGRLQQLECNGDAFMANNAFVRNIVCFRQGAAIKVNRWHDKVLAECDRNLYWFPGAEKAPGAFFPKGSWAKWQEAGYDKGSLIADPLFVDPAKDDYHLKPDSPALKLGFQEIDISKIGVEGYHRPAELP